jgi:hypothetical protein
MYKAAGYDFLAVSDHNRVTATQQYNIPAFLTFPNDELTFRRDHVNAVNIPGSHPSGPSATLQDVINLALNANAIAMINHPSWSSHTPQKITGTSGATLMEVIQHFDDLDYDAMVWDAFLSTGRQIYGTGTDDAHNYTTDFNTGWIVVRADSLELNEIITGIQNGDFYASNGVTITDLTMQNRELCVDTQDGDSIIFIGKDGEVLKREGAAVSCHTLSDTGMYIRAKVVNSGGNIGYTQAYFPGPVGISLHNDKIKAPFQLTARPNPFNPHTKIEYSVRGEAWQPVKLEIFDVSGRKIKTLVSCLKPRGEYSSIWNGKDDFDNNMCNGVYVYRLSVGSKRISRSIIKLK